MSKMPSRAAVRVLTILSLIEASALQAGSQSGVLTCKGMQYVKAHCKVATNGWAVAGSEQALVPEVLKALGNISVGLDAIWWLQAKQDMNYPGMLYVCMQLVDDLMQLITDRKRSRWLQNIHDGLTVLIDRVDPEGMMLLTQDRTQEIVNVIYDVVGER